MNYKPDRRMRLMRFCDAKIPVTYLVLSFILNFLWENAQSPLYVWTIHGWQKEFRVLSATATGDMIFLVMIYLAIAATHRRLLWINDRQSYMHPATWIIPIFLGTLIAISFELWAVYINHRWQYAPLMPIIPIVQVGLSPVMQMIAIPAAVIGMCGILINKKKE